MKEYKVLFKRLKTGEYVRPASLFSSGIFKTKSAAVNYAKDYLKRDKEHDIQYYCGYKIMVREVSKWEDC